MAEAYIGEIRCFGFNFAPYQWAFCNGQPMAISQYTALFSILGTTFGGNGTTTFNLPNLQGQIPMHWGTTAGLPATSIGQVQGQSNVTLTVNQIPIHTHPATAATSSSATERTNTPSATCFLSGVHAPDLPWQKTPTLAPQFAANAISQTGTSLPHDNMQPYLTLNFCISLFGVFPSRS
ncbi:MAG: tail fiber protein [Xanthobacteraceae bacterium]